MPTGMVKWFNNAKGYGFVLADNSEEDLFAHFSNIEMDGYKTLKAGQEISFEVIDGNKGKHATNIQLAEKHRLSSAVDSEPPELEISQH